MKSPKPSNRKSHNDESLNDRLMARLRDQIDTGMVRELLLDIPETSDPRELCYILHRHAHDLGHEVFRLVRVLNVEDEAAARLNLRELIHTMKYGQQSAERCLRLTRALREVLHTLDHALTQPSEARRKRRDAVTDLLTGEAANTNDHDFDLAEAFRTFFASAKPWTRKAKISVSLELVDGMLVQGTLMEFHSILWTLLQNTTEALQNHPQKSRRIFILVRPLGGGSTKDVAVTEYRDGASQESPGLNISTKEMLQSVRTFLKARFAGDISVVESKGRHWVASIPVHRRK